MKHQQKITGFTIVELLIVIVVIAILAAISIVAFNGIQDRAKNAQLLASVDAAEKILKLYKAEHGNYPATFNIHTGESLVGTSTPYACLGKASDYPAQGALPAGACYGYGASDGSYEEIYASHSNILSQQLETVASGLSVDVSSAGISVPLEGGWAEARGLVYYGYADGGQTEAVLMYFMEGDRQCGRGVKDFSPPGPETPPTGMTVCTIDLR